MMSEEIKDSTTTTIKCCQINLQKSVIPSIAVNKSQDPILFVTEPNARKQGILNLGTPDKKVFSGKPWPRAGLRIHKSLHPWLIPSFTDRDICTVAIKISNNITYVCSAYLDINLDPRNQLLIDVIHHCSRKSIPLVIGMDSNSHSGLWGCSETNQRGAALEELFSYSDLTVMNMGEEPTFRSNRAESIIDVTVVNEYALQNLEFKSWRVDPKPSHSDHRYIKFELGKLMPRIEYKRNWKKVQWHIFRTLNMNNSYPHITDVCANRDGCANLDDRANLDECAEQLQTILTNNLNQVAPRKKVNTTKSNRWWNDDIAAIWSEVEYLAPWARNSEGGMNAYRSLKNTLSREIRKAKRKTWKKFCTETNSPKELSKLIEALKPKPPGGVSLFSQGGDVLEPADTLAELMNTHFPESTEVDDDREMEAVFINSKVTSGPLERYVTPDKVKKALMSFGPHKAAGPDDFKPILLQQLDDSAYQYISKLYQKVLRTGYTPKTWRQMKVIFMPKAGKESYGKAKSYRPITLSNFLLKGLERLVQWYISDVIITKPLYAQHAYTAGRSCDTALSFVVDKIEKSITRGEYCLAVSLDCSGAFDNIKFDSAKRAMKRKNIPAEAVEWYDNLLRNRCVASELQGESNMRIPTRGSPQGGVLSPLIWNLIMDTLLSDFDRQPVQVCGYADDIFLLVCGKDLPTLRNLMQSALNKVSSWGERNGLNFNPQKTQMVWFTKARRNKPRFQKYKLTVNGQTLDQQDELTYLGVTLRYDLSWRKHLLDKVGKGKKLLNLAKAAVGREWGLDPQRALWTYTAFVRPMITHGSIVWASRMTSSQKKALDSVQRLALLNITHSMRSTPTRGMEVTLGLEPLHIHAMRLAAQCGIRIRDDCTESWDGIGNNSKITGHAKQLDTLVAKTCPRMYPIDHMTRRRDWITNEVVEQPEITLFTDGSKLDGEAGMGWAICRDDSVLAEERCYLGRRASVFQAEVIAIHRALQWVQENCPEPTSVKIRSDSQAAISAIFAVETASKIVHDCREVLKKSKENHRIGIEWIKGHANHTGNELADMLAKEGSMLRTQHCDPVTPIPMCDIKMDIKLLCHRKWQEEWDGEKACRQTKLFFPRVGEKITKLTSVHSKRNLNLLVQAGTGHALVAHHLGQWQEMQDQCKMCLEDYETTEHLFFECPAMQSARRDALQYGTTEKRIISFFNCKVMRDLFTERSNQCQTNVEI